MSMKCSSAWGGVRPEDDTTSLRGPRRGGDGGPSGPRAPGWSVGPAGSDDGLDGAQADREVTRHPPVVDVVEVQRDARVPAQVGPAADLPQPRHPRLHG